jgi:SAM-dependent methyltransferase
MMFNQSPLDQVKAYFGRRIQEHGATPRGVDWNSEDSQYTRFDQLLKVIQAPGPFSLLDYGCGYGALADYLAEKGFDADYNGFDIVESAIELATKLHRGQTNCKFFTGSEDFSIYDYTVASGIFNVRSEQSLEDWTNYVLSVLHQINELSRKGFASNFLTKYSDPARMRAELYYADPLYLFDYCKKNFSKNVALLHDYQIYDFTLIVRKD